MLETTNDISSLVLNNEQRYISGTGTVISKYVTFDMYENINKIEAYINSKHTTGDMDSMYREKPFFNIVTSATNVWYRATDIDRKNIRIKATKQEDVLGAMVATVHLQDWMRRDNFGVFLNEWGRTLARYGSAVSKFVEKDGKLHADVIPWNRLIVDSVNFDNDVVIEVLEYTPAQLKSKKGYDQDMVDNLLESLEVRRTMDKRNKDTKAEFIKVYEVHGEIALSYLTGNAKDDYTFVQQMHAISFVESKQKGKFDDFTLVAGKEKKNPYMISHLIKEDGRTQAIGAVEHLFDAQWMQNWSVKTVKDQLDLASKLIYQTSDGNFVGQNVLSAIENGDILIHEVNQPITQINNGSHDITQVQNYAAQWKELGNEINGISESMLGQNAPSGTAWRQTEALLQESHSLFEIMTENKGLSIEEMMRIHVIPHLKTKMNTSKEVQATVDDMGVTQIERMYVKKEAIKRRNDTLVQEFRNGGSNFQIDQAPIEKSITDELNSSNGSQRFFVPSEEPDKTWADIFKDLEWDVEVEVTGESSDKQAALTTLNTTLQIIMSKQGQPMSPEEKLVFNKILSLSGEISPLEFSNMQAEPAVAPVAPVAPVQSPVTPDVAQPVT